MPAADTKTQPTTSGFEIDSPRMMQHGHYSQSKTASAVDAARTALAVLALCAGATVLGVSADALAVYDATHVPESRMLPLWPDNFDLRPTVAMVVCATVIIGANATSLLAGKIQFIRQRPILHSGLGVLAAAGGLIAAIIAVGFFYGMGAEGSGRDTLESWSCRWEDVFMTARPHFGTLCKQSRAGAYLSVLLIPVEVLALGVAAWQGVLERSGGGVEEFVPRREKSRGGEESVPSSRGGEEVAR